MPIIVFLLSLFFCFVVTLITADYLVVEPQTLSMQFVFHRGVAYYVGGFISGILAFALTAMTIHRMSD